MLAENKENMIQVIVSHLASKKQLSTEKFYFHPLSISCSSLSIMDFKVHSSQTGWEFSVYVGLLLPELDMSIWLYYMYITAPDCINNVFWQ